MALVKQCNRCKKIIDDEHLHLEFYHDGKYIHDPTFHFPVHLCPDCEKAFHDFLDTPPFNPLAGIEVKPAEPKKQTLLGKLLTKHHA